jgi:hypothetical protein
MRAVKLAKIAAEAEILRIQHMLKRQGMRAAFGLVAVLFAFGVLVLAHVAGWQALQLYVPPIYATLTLLSVDLVIAAIFGILAARSSPSRDEREALTIRQRALHEARSSLALGALIPVAGTLLRSRRRREESFGGGSDSAATVSAPWGEMVLVKFIGAASLVQLLSVRAKDAVAETGR